VVVVVAGVVAQLRALRSGSPLAESCLFLLLVIVVVVVAVVVVVVVGVVAHLRALRSGSPLAESCLFLLLVSWLLSLLVLLLNYVLCGQGRHWRSPAYSCCWLVSWLLLVWLGFEILSLLDFLPPAHTSTAYVTNTGPTPRAVSPAGAPLTRKSR
jgi:hypothetical protein